MSKWRAVKLKQELVDQAKEEAEKSNYRSLSEFVSEAIQLRLQTLTEERASTRLERPQIIGVRKYTCTNDFVHDVKVVTYDDSSIWVMCPMFGWFGETDSGRTPKLGCKERKKHCTWFVG